MYTCRPSVVTLSRGSTWNPHPWDPPYTLPNDVLGGAWPDGLTVQTVFYNTAGAVLAVAEGTAAPGGLSLGPAAPEVIDLVPNGANFEVFITTADGDPYMIRYGKVIRRESEFRTAQVAGASNAGVSLAESWPTMGIRTTWKQVAGSTVVHDNSGLALANGVGSPNLAGGQSDNTLRYFRPLNGDSATVRVTGLNQHSYLADGFARMRIILCSDSAMTTYIAVELGASGTGGGPVNQLRFATGTSPIAVDYVGSPVVYAFADGDTITVRYDEGSDDLNVYLNASLSPFATWNDTGIPHGPGHRYLGLGWSTSMLSDGLQATSWQASDVL